MDVNISENWNPKSNGGGVGRGLIKYFLSHYKSGNSKYMLLVKKKWIVANVWLS